MPGKGLENSTPKRPPPTGTSSKVTPTKHPPKEDSIGPPIALNQDVIMVSPLAWSYKYEKLREDEGFRRI
nr:hypothetical protein CFP56_74710 [Quercus suber]